jgi:uncharacterized integral membrane protein (TIGR00698 family)
MTVPVADDRRSSLAILPGLAAAIVVALAARASGLILPATISAVTIAVLIGLLVGQIPAVRSAGLEPGLAFTATRVLRLGIVLLGARLSFDQILGIGLPAAVVVIVTMTAALLLVLALSRVAAVEPALAVLLAVGAAVCGNSAVVATAPVIGARSRDVAYAVATVTLFGTAAVFLYPIVGHAIPLGDVAFGLWSGIAINDTSQVVAASSAFSPGALEVATVVKLIRNALMAPLLIGIAWSWARSGRTAGDTSAGLRKAVPLFVLGFVAMAALRTVGIIDANLAAILDVASGWLIVTGLAAVGLSIRFEDLRAIGPRALAVGFGAAVIIGLVTLGGILVAGPGLRLGA